MRIDARTAVAQALRALREDAGLTMGETARHLGCSRVAVSRWETGSRTPGVNDLASLAALYGVDPGEFFAPARQDIERARRELAPAKTKRRS